MFTRCTPRRQSQGDTVGAEHNVHNTYVFTLFYWAARRYQPHAARSFLPYRSAL